MEDTTTKRYIILLIAALWLGLCASAHAEQSAFSHDTTHQTVEVARQETHILRTGSPETHTQLIHYDLYCIECGKVITADVRIDQIEEPHVWNVIRREPTCSQLGEEIKSCVLCGMEVSTPLPMVDHQWGEWEEAPVDQQHYCETDATARRVCQVCGKVETKVVSPAPGHQWSESSMIPATCTEPAYVAHTCTVCGKTESIASPDSPALGHEFADAAQLTGRPAGEVQSGGSVIGTVIVPSTCEEAGSGTLLCLRCQAASQSVSIPPKGHTFGDWTPNEVPAENACEQEITSSRVCSVCGKKETRVDSPAPGHKWVTVSYTMPTCTEAGTAMQRCSVCQKEQTIKSPALGHSYAWVDVSEPSPTADGLSEYVCCVCGDVAEQRKVPYKQMMYNNTITSFGPTTRDLIGGSVWNRVTPIDLSLDGVYTYPLVASNRYTVGTATVTVEKGKQMVTYRLNSSSILVHSESLVIYPSLEALRTGENAASFAFSAPFQIEEYFGDDEKVILAITLKADFNAVGFGVQSFTPDQQQIDAMLELLD